MPNKVALVLSDPPGQDGGGRSSTPWRPIRSGEVLIDGDGNNVGATASTLLSGVTSGQVLRNDDGDFAGGLQTFTVANAPSAVAGDLGYCTNGANGSPCLCFYDGSNWKQVNDPTVTITATAAVAEIINAVVDSPTGSRTKGVADATWTDIDAALEEDFVVTVAGIYAFFVRHQIYNSSTGGDGYLGLLVDEGDYNDFSAQSLKTLDERGFFNATPTEGAAAHRAEHVQFLGTLTLAAGTHKAQPQWYGGGGAGNLVADTATPFHVWCFRV